jgi:DNA-binding transcriptional ArsR family regulator
MIRDLERMLKAAADVTRLRILRMLEGGELCVCQIVEVLGLSQSTVSKHLLLLRNAGLIEDEKRGKWVFYRRAERGTAGWQGALAGVLADSLRRDPALDEDLRSVRQPRVRKLAACCPSRPRKGGMPVRGAGRRGARS